MVLAAFAMTERPEPPSGPVEFAHRGRSDQYHWQVRRAIDFLPETIHNWHGEEIHTLEPVRSLISPNVILSRRYRNEQAGGEIDLLIVQSRDARDMNGFDPVLFYHRAGHELISFNEQHYGGETNDISGRRYRFGAAEGEPRGIVVDTFIVLPDGRVEPDMAKAITIWDNKVSRLYGAAQVQLVTSADMTDTERDEAVSEILSACDHLLHVIRSGVEK